MQKFNTLSDAIRLAEFAHFKQVDKAGLPYIEHPKRVLEKVKAQGALPYVQMAAILHDITEDTKITPEMLLGMGFPESAVRIVKLLDRGVSAKSFHEANKGRDLDLSGKFYISLGPQAQDEFYYQQINQSPGAKMVKIADIEDNLSPWRLAYLEKSTQERLRAKYAHALEILNG